MRRLKFNPMKLLAIRENEESNSLFLEHPECAGIVLHMIDFYKRVGFTPPYIGYFAKLGENVVGTAGFKGGPVDGKVEIAYATFPRFQNQGIATQMCHLLIELAIQANPKAIISARTLPEKNYSTKVLEKNHFTLAGPVMDPEDGEVWEWVYGIRN